MRLLNGLMMNRGCRSLGLGFFVLLQWVDWLNFTEQQEHEQHHQNDAPDAHAGVTQTIPVAAETATKAAQQVNDHENDQYQSERHCFLLNGPAGERIQPPTLREKHIPAFGSSEGTRGFYFG